MAQRIVYFTAGRVATTQEKADIAEIAAVVDPQFSLSVFNAEASPNYGAGIAEADYVAGTIPTPYSDAEVYPVFNPDNPPFALPPAQAIVSDEMVLVIGPTSYTFTVVNNEITAIVAV